MQTTTRQKFNINDRVRVKLTEAGKFTFSEHYEELNLHRNNTAPRIQTPKIREDAEGFSEWQLWELMYIFGHDCYMGAKLPFETEIELLTQG